MLMTDPKQDLVNMKRRQIDVAKMDLFGEMERSRTKDIAKYIEVGPLEELLANKINVHGWPELQYTQLQRLAFELHLLLEHVSCGRT